MYLQTIAQTCDLWHRNLDYTATYWPILFGKITAEHFFWQNEMFCCNLFLTQHVITSPSIITGLVWGSLINHLISGALLLCGACNDIITCMSELRCANVKKTLKRMRVVLCEVRVFLFHGSFVIERSRCFLCSQWLRRFTPSQQSPCSPECRVHSS